MISSPNGSPYRMQAALYLLPCSFSAILPHQQTSSPLPSHGRSSTWFPRSLRFQIFKTLVPSSQIFALFASDSVEMGETKDNDAYEEELLDYEEEDEKAPDSVSAKASGDGAKKLVLSYEMWKR
ncbi:hypothetical protein Ancab_012030 [Ancistrocladus abbreviatus]